MSQCAIGCQTSLNGRLHTLGRGEGDCQGLGCHAAPKTLIETLSKLAQSWNGCRSIDNLLEESDNCLIREFFGQLIVAEDRGGNILLPKGIILVDAQDFLYHRVKAGKIVDVDHAIRVEIFFDVGVSPVNRNASLQ